MRVCFANKISMTYKIYYKRLINLILSLIENREFFNSIKVACIFILLLMLICIKLFIL